MDIWIKFAILIVAAYLFGSVPLSYLVARSRGIDLRKQGTQQVGGGNLWRTTSHKLGLSVGIFEFLKGALMVFIAWRLGLDAGQQLLVGLGAVIGHNWPVFLHFHGGRGIATTLGIIIIMPCTNIGEITPWPMVACIGVAVGSLTVFRRTPVPILLGLIILPIVSAAVKEPLMVTLGYTAMTLIIIAKRLIAQSSAEKRQIGMTQLLLNRFLFDRDVRNRVDWVNRKTADKKG
ncbi:MAG: glycerol-3-phosphate acyltransferase [Dehalococcoidales bacterium]